MFCENGFSVDLNRSHGFGVGERQDRLLILAVLQKGAALATMFSNGERSVGVLFARQAWSVFKLFEVSVGNSTFSGPELLLLSTLRNGVTNYPFSCRVLANDWQPSFFVQT